MKEEEVKAKICNKIKSDEASEKKNTIKIHRKYTNEVREKY